MKDELLKTSLRHAQSYINAYGVEWLQEIEEIFRDAILQPEEENERFSGEIDAPLKTAQKLQTTEAPTRPLMELQARNAQESQPVAIEPPLAMPLPRPLAGWHFQLPAIVTVLGVILLILFLR
jgi:hypothetical protein